MSTGAVLPVQGKSSGGGLAELLAYLIKTVAPPQQPALQAIILDFKVWRTKPCPGWCQGMQASRCCSFAGCGARLLAWARLA